MPRSGAASAQDDRRSHGHGPSANRHPVGTARETWRIAGLAAGAALIVLAVLPAAAQPGAGEIERGYAVFTKWCAPCHGAGPARPGTQALAARYGDALPALLEERTDLTPAFVETIVRHGTGLMAQFRKTEISDDDLDALTTYLTRER
jgi:(+)-pinoresinol hydroxylase